MVLKSRQIPVANFVAWSVTEHVEHLADQRLEFATSEAGHWMYRRAVDADPTDATNLGNYACLLFMLGRMMMRKERCPGPRLARARRELPLLAERNFYLFSHSATFRQQSGTELKALLSRGVSTGAWSFADNVARVGRDDGTRAEPVTAVASAFAI